MNHIKYVEIKFKLKNKKNICNKGATEGPSQFFEGVATGTENLFDSVVGGACGAIARITGAVSKGLASITLDDEYQTVRIQRKELQSQTSTELSASGRNAMKVLFLL